jgi:hypothetical protein
LHSQQHAGLIPAHNEKRPSTPESSTSHSPSLPGFENRPGSLKVLWRASAPESKASRFFGCRTRIGVEPRQNESVGQRGGEVARRAAIHVWWFLDCSHGTSEPCRNRRSKHGTSRPLRSQPFGPPPGRTKKAGMSPPGV